MDARPGGFGPPAHSGSGSLESSTHVSTPVAAANLDAVEVDLARLADLTIAEHVGVFAGIHQQLANALAVTAAQGNAQVGASPSGPPAPGNHHPNRPQPGQSQAFGQRGR